MKNLALFIHGGGEGTYEEDNIREFDDREHQFDNYLSDVARDIEKL